ncbi:hypothetical protein FACS189485_22870 [Spirochaetia bacterium]|nr:hypothetical protein FACS189485_22870 [Spirochaetia bacterium]
MDLQKRDNYLDLLKKALFASSINVLILCFVIILMGIVGDGNQWFVVLPLSIVNSIIISKIIKYCYNYFFAILFTIIISIIVYNIIVSVSIKIKPIHNIIIKIFETTSFEGFMGNYIGIMVFIIFSLLLTIIITLVNWTSGK